MACVYAEYWPAKAYNTKTNHEAHEEHEEKKNLCVLGGLRGSKIRRSQRYMRFPYIAGFCGCKKNPHKITGMTMAEAKKGGQRLRSFHLWPPFSGLLPITGIIER
jgi:hypothetical protein